MKARDYRYTMGKDIPETAHWGIIMLQRTTIPDLSRSHRRPRARQRAQRRRQQEQQICHFIRQV